MKATGTPAKRGEAFSSKLFKRYARLMLLWKNVHCTSDFEWKELAQKQLIILADRSGPDSFVCICGKIAKELHESALRRLRVLVASKIVGLPGSARKQKFLGITPDILNASDPRAAESMKERIRAGESILYLPEETDSVCGTMQPIPPTIIPCLKAAGVDVIVAITSGAYLKRPSYSSQPRSGKLKVHFSRLFTPEQLKSHSNGEL